MGALSHLRRNLAHIVVAASIIAVLGLLAFAHLRTPGQASSIGLVFANALHAPAFLGFAVFVFVILRMYRSGITNYLHAGVIALAVGVLFEASQLPGPRDASLFDLVLDTIGIVGGIGTLAMFDRVVRARLSTPALVVAGLVSAVALFLAIAPSAYSGYATFSQARAMPELLSFEHFWEKHTYRQGWNKRPELIPAPGNWPADSGRVAVAFEAGPPGLFIRFEPYPNWSGYSNLSFVAVSGDGQQRKLTVDIRGRSLRDGRGRRRVLEEVEIGGEPSRVRIALDQLRRISPATGKEEIIVDQVRISASEPGSEAPVYFDDFRLE